MPTNILMPALSPTMTEGTLAKWLKKEGDNVKAGDVIAEIETDKATMEVEAVDEGKLGKILIASGTAGVAVNTPIAVLLEEGESVDAIKAAAPINSNQKVAAPGRSQELPLRLRRLRVSKQQATGGRVFATPLARRIAEQKGVDLSSVQGSGPHGRIVKADLENAKSGAAAPKPAAAQKPMAAGADAKALSNAYGMEYSELPNNNIKKIVARRLLESKQSVPHFYLTVDCRIDGLLGSSRQAE